MQTLQTASSNIVKSFPEIEHFICTQSLSKSALDLADEIAERYAIKISPSTIRKYRKGLPSYKIGLLREERAKNIESLQFLVDILKSQLDEIEDPALKLRYIQEIAGCIKEVDKLLDDEISFLRSSNPF